MFNSLIEFVKQLNILIEGVFKLSVIVTLVVICVQLINIKNSFVDKYEKVQTMATKQVDKSISKMEEAKGAILKKKDEIFSK